MLSFNIPVSMIRQFCFCPRIPYFFLLRGLSPPAGLWVEQGISHHDKMQMLMKRRRLSKFHIDADSQFNTQINLYDEELKLHGICDAVLCSHDETIVLEFKLQENVVSGIGYELQLTAYGMLLERKLGIGIKRGFILYGSRGCMLEVFFNNGLRNKVTSIISNIEDSVQTAIMPASCATERQCGQCEYLNFCADRL